MKDEIPKLSQDLTGTTASTDLLQADQMRPLVSPLPANEGRLEQAKRFALMNFDKWNDVTGFVEPHCSYYYEICGCLEDAVEFGFGVAHGQNFKTIVHKIRKIG